MLTESCVDRAAASAQPDPEPAAGPLEQPALLHLRHLPGGLPASAGQVAFFGRLCEARPNPEKHHPRRYVCSALYNPLIAMALLG